MTGACIFWGRTSADIAFNEEHIIPRSIGGTYVLLDAVCVECNSTLGSHVDVQILRMPEVLSAYEALGMEGERAAVLSRNYEITGSLDGLTLRSGKLRGTEFSFPDQPLDDGSMLYSAGDWTTPLAKTLARDAEFRELGLTSEEISTKLDTLRTAFQELSPSK